METAQSIRAQIAGLPDHEAVEILLGYIDWYLPSDNHDYFFEELGLAPQRVHLLTCLAKNKGRAITRATLVAYIDTDADPKICDTHLCCIRKALKAADWPVDIETVWGTGYRLTASEDFHFPWEAV